MKLSTLASICAAAATAAAAFMAGAQSPAAYKFAYVNTERVMREARAPQQAQKSLEAEFQKRDQDIVAAEERLKRMAAELEKNGVAMPAAERLKREREAGDLQRDIQRRRNILGEDFNIRRDEALRQVIAKANGIIKRIAEQEKLDIVFLEAAYADKRIDITDRVIKAFDAAK